MRVDKLTAFARRCWPSKTTTVVFLLLYGAWLGRGVWLGIGELYDRHPFVKARMTYVATQRRWINMQGMANLVSLRSEHHKCWFQGASDINIKLDDVASAEVRIVFEFDDTPLECHLWIVDIASKASHYLYDLHPWRVDATIPVPIAKTTLHIVTSHPQIRYRIVDLECNAPMRSERLETVSYWKPLYENESARLYAGSGVELPKSTAGPRDFGKDDVLFLRRNAYLRVESKRPGDCWVAFPFKKLDPRAPDPQITNDRLPLNMAPDITEFGGKDVMLAAFGTHLKPVAVLGLSFRGEVRSQRELGLSKDPRPLAYGIMPGQFKIVKTTPDRPQSRPATSSVPQTK